MNEELEKIRAKLSTIVRDITAIGWAPKSEAKRLMSGLLDEAFQAGHTSAVSEIREKKRQKDTTDPKKLTDYGKGFMSGFNQYSDEMDKILEGMEK